jgi:hypothetical protein
MNLHLFLPAARSWLQYLSPSRQVIAAEAEVDPLLSAAARMAVSKSATDQRNDDT